MGNWLTKSSKVTQLGPDYSLTSFTTSLMTRPVPIVYGQQRVSGNVIWYGFFHYTTSNSGGSGGGKGGGGGGGGKGGQGSTFTYYVSVIFSFCEGPINSIPSIYYGQYQQFFPYYFSNGMIPGSITSFNGSSVQGTWGYMDSVEPGQSLNYRNNATINISNLNLGQSSSLTNISAEIVSPISGGFAGIVDANPADIIFDFLTNVEYGVPLFPINILGDLSDYRMYCRALGLFMSVSLTAQTSAQQFLIKITHASNSEFVWSSGVLKLVPYTDQTVTSAFGTHVVSLSPIYDLTDDDLMPDQSSLSTGDSAGKSPISISRKPRSQMINSMVGSYQERGLYYASVPVEIRDEGSIAAYNVFRPSDMQQLDMFCIQSAAAQSLGLQLHRAQIACTYGFTLGAWAVLLDPMDIVTLTDPQLGMFRQAVRITEITENQDGSLSFIADEVFGTLGAPNYGAQAAMAPPPNTNADPGLVNPPIFFEPPYTLANGLEVWAAVSGVNITVWGGCDVWISSDDITYALAGTINGVARMGATTSALPSVTESDTGQTIDGTSTLGVDLTESLGGLVSVSSAALVAADTICYLDGEFIAFQTATLTAANKYNLTTLLRGAYGSPIGAHPAGVPFTRADVSLFKTPYKTTDIGSTVYMKFISFNLWGGGGQELSSVPAYNYKITGSPLLSQIATPQNLRTVFSAGFEELWWDEVTDFRPNIRYFVTSGTSPGGAQTVGDLAHPPFLLLGAGTYYVTAYCSPAVGLTATSLPSAPVSVAGNMLIANSLVIRDQQAEGWPGTKSNIVVDGASPNQFLALDAATAGPLAEALYTIPLSQIVNLGYFGVLALNATWLATGIGANDNILSIADFLAQTDVFGAKNIQYVLCSIEVQIGISDGAGGITWAPWQKFIPGNYQGQYANFRVRFSSSNTNVIPVLVNFSFQAAVPARIDHYQNISVAAAGTTITFIPDGGSVPGAFNGGPNAAALPYVNVSFNNQAGDVLQISALSLSSVKVQVLNGGVGVARTGLNIDVEGY
jgi:hypothetical protein